MRLFIGIDLPRSFKEELNRLQRQLKQVSADGRFVPKENFHITLHFIGESNDLAGAVSAMQEAVRGIRPFELHLGKYGSFQKGTSRTAFLHVLGESEELDRLYESLQSALYDQGFSRERKRFTPHITLGRNVECDEVAEAEMLRLSPNASMQVREIVLFESTREEGRMLYAPLHRARF